MEFLTLEAELELDCKLRFDKTQLNTIELINLHRQGLIHLKELESLTESEISDAVIYVICNNLIEK